MYTPYKNTVETGKIYSYILCILIWCMICMLYLKRGWTGTGKIFLYSIIFLYSMSLYSVSTVLHEILLVIKCSSMENRDYHLCLLQLSLILLSSLYHFRFFFCCHVFPVCLICSNWSKIYKEYTFKYLLFSTSWYIYNMLTQVLSFKHVVIRDNILIPISQQIG